MDSASFPDRLKAALKLARMSQADLAADLGVNKSTVTYWAQGGTPELSKLPTIAHRLRVSTDYLLGAENDLDDPVDLALIVGGGRAMWSGEPLSDDRRRRAYAALHAVLAPLHEIATYPQAGSQGTIAQESNPARQRATVTARRQRRRPKPERPDDNAQTGVPGPEVARGREDRES